MRYESETQLYTYTPSDGEAPDLSDGDYYINSIDYPLSELVQGGVYAYNIDFATMQPIYPDEPMFAVTFPPSYSEGPFTIACGNGADLSNTTVKILKKVSGGGGSDLPAPGAAGNVLTSNGTAWESAAPSAPLPEAGADGNVLTADDGEWVSAAPIKPLVVTYNEDEHTITGASLSDIVAAYANKTPVYIYSSEMLLPVIQAFNEDDEYRIDAGSFWYYDGLYIYIRVYYDGTAWDSDISNIPSASASANGKVLGVESGNYAFVDTKYPLILTGAEGSGTAVTVSGATLAEIYEAAHAGRYVAVDIPLTALGGVTARLPLIIYNYDSTDEEYSFGFSMAIPVTSNGLLVTITLDNSLTGEIEQKTWAVTG